MNYNQMTGKQILLERRLIRLLFTYARPSTMALYAPIKHVAEPESLNLNAEGESATSDSTLAADESSVTLAGMTEQS